MIREPVVFTVDARCSRFQLPNLVGNKEQQPHAFCLSSISLLLGRWTLFYLFFLLERCWAVAMECASHKGNKHLAFEESKIEMERKNDDVSRLRAVLLILFFE
jgi:hypothetical protein